MDFGDDAYSCGYSIFIIFFGHISLRLNEKPYLASLCAKLLFGKER